MNSKCLFCQQTIRYPLTIEWLVSFVPIKERLLCDECNKSFKRITGKVCDGCGREILTTLCHDCQLWQKKDKKLLHNRALFHYQTPEVKEYFERYKFMGDYYYRKIFQDEFQLFIKKNFPQNKWNYVPIPVDSSTLTKTRRFNQVTGLIEKLPTVECLEMIDAHHQVKQSHLKRKERMKTRQPFCLSSNADVTDKMILLIDDIYTTGRTLYHAQKVLMDAGAKCVRSVTLAR